MRKIYIEIIFSLLFVAVSTTFIYGKLSGIESFWNSQFIWSIILSIGWVVVAFGYYHQGWKVKLGHSSKNVSLVLPSAVFVVQCVLFVKGIYYSDWSLITGALMVNSGVVFCIYQILRSRHKKRS